MLEAEKLRQQIGWDHAHDHSEKAQHRADRQIDIAGNDDERHTGRHDRDRRRLHRQIPQVARREKKAAGKQVKGDPDRHQSADHAKKPCVELGDIEEAGDGEQCYASGFSIRRHASLRGAKRRSNPVKLARDCFVALLLAMTINTDQPQTLFVPGFTPWQTSSFLIHPASITTSRLSLVIGIGVRNSEFISTFFWPPENFTAPGTSPILAPPANRIAICAAFLPSSRASFHTDTVCVPSAMRLSAA